MVPKDRIGYFTQKNMGYNGFIAVGGIIHLAVDCRRRIILITNHPSILQPFKRGCMDSLPIVAGYIPACLTFGLIGKGLNMGDLEVLLLSMLVYAGASQFIGVKLLAAGAAAPVVLLLTLIINLRYLFISLSFSRKLKSSFSIFQKGIVGFGLTEEVFAVSTMSHRNEQGKSLTLSYMLGLELLPYTASLLATGSGIWLAEYIPGNLLPALNTSLYSLLIVLIVPLLFDSRSNLAVFIAAAVSSWLLQPYLGTAAVLVAMLAGGWAGGIIQPKENKKIRRDVL
ncbi:Inner membrane protein YgaZ [compost metagenome]